MDVIDPGRSLSGWRRYDITPQLPVASFTLRMRDVGVASQPGPHRGPITAGSSTTVTVAVTPPPTSTGHSLQAFANGQAVSSPMENGLMVYELPMTAGSPANGEIEAFSS